MGNRAMVVFEDTADHRSPAVYLHWNGGPESIYAFLDAAKEYGVRDASDPIYSAARFVQIVGNFFGGTLSLGISNIPDTLEELDPGDNGLYVVTKYGMRRYTASFAPNSDKPVGHWWTPEEIAAEREQAYEHAYHTGDNNIAQQIRAKNDAAFKSKD